MRASRNIGMWFVMIIMMALASAASAQEHLLRLNYKEGETYQYKISLEMEIRAETLPGGKTTIQEDRVHTRKVGKVFPDGSAEVLITHTDYELRQNKEVISSKANDGLSVLGFPVDVPILMKVSNRSENLEIRPAKELRPSQKAQVEAVFQNLKNLSPGLPEKPVKVGDTWDREILTATEAPGLGTIDISLQATFTFAGIETFYGVKCVKITGKGSGMGTLEGGGGTIEMTVSSESLLDLEGGREMKHKERGDYQLNLFTDGGERTINQTMTQTTVIGL